MSKSGWFKESRRHALASKGIKTGTHTTESCIIIPQTHRTALYWHSKAGNVYSDEELAKLKEQYPDAKFWTMKDGKIVQDPIKKFDKKADQWNPNPKTGFYVPFNEIHDKVQKEVYDKFEEMVRGGDKYVVTTEGGGQPPKQYGLMGLCGFSSIKFHGVKEKNMLEKAGMRVTKSYPSGFSVDASDIIQPQERHLAMHPDARAYFSQSVDLKEVANRAFLKQMQEHGFLKDAYVDSRLD